MSPIGRTPRASSDRARTGGVDASTRERLPLALVGDDEQMLVARVRAGDAEAFEGLFRAYYGPLASFAYSYTQSREMAEEIVQDVLLSVWEQRETWDVTQRVRAYLYAGVRNQALNRIRHQRVAERVESRLRAAAVDAESELAAALPPADAAMHEAELQDAIRRAVDALPARCRQAFVLNRQHGMSHAEIAELMGTTVRTVEAQVYKARQLLRVALAAWLDR